MRIPTHFNFSRRNFRRFLSLGVLSAACLAPVCAHAVTPVAAAAEVETAFNQFRLTWENKDLNAATASFAADAIAYDPAPPGRYEGTAEIKKWIADTFQALEQIRIPVSGVKVRTSGAVAWVNAHYQFKSVAGGQASSDEGNVTIVWVKQIDGTYRIVSFHASTPPGAPAVVPPSNANVKVN